MKPTTFPIEITLPRDGQEIEAGSVHQGLQEVGDGRTKRGRRYETALVLSIIVLAKMAGESALSGVAHWAQLRLEWLQERLPLKQSRLPCANTYRYVCDHIQLGELNEKLRAFFAQAKEAAWEPEEAELNSSAVHRGEQHLALDGKRPCAGQRRQQHPSRRPSSCWGCIM